MPTDPTRAEFRQRLARGDRLHTAHLVLCGAFALWRGIEATPSLSSVEGATWSSTALGRAFALVTMLCCLAALATIVVTTLRSRRDPGAWALFAALLLALAWRGSIDVFDLVYGGMALAFGAYWFRERRAELVEAVLAREPGVSG